MQGRIVAVAEQQKRGYLRFAVEHVQAHLSGQRLARSPVAGLDGAIRQSAEGELVRGHQGDRLWVARCRLLEPPELLKRDAAIVERWPGRSSPALPRCVPDP